MPCAVAWSRRAALSILPASSDGIGLIQCSCTHPYVRVMPPWEIASTLRAATIPSRTSMNWLGHDDAISYPRAVHRATPLALTDAHRAPGLPNAESPMRSSNGRQRSSDRPSRSAGPFAFAPRTRLATNVDIPSGSPTEKFSDCSRVPHAQVSSGAWSHSCAEPHDGQQDRSVVPCSGHCSSAAKFQTARCQGIPSPSARPNATVGFRSKAKQAGHQRRADALQSCMRTTSAPILMVRERVSVLGDQAANVPSGSLAALSMTPTWRPVRRPSIETPTFTANLAEFHSPFRTPHRTR